MRHAASRPGPLVRISPRRALLAFAGLATALATAGARADAVDGDVTAQAAPLTLEATLASSLEHFPRIQSAVQETLIRAGRVTAALGAFDLALEQESLVWADGFYDGMSVDNRLVKPLGPANAKVFAGYRASNDDFPVYQQELVTNDGGEFNLGVLFSLWRDREIDQRRFGVSAAELGVREAEIGLVLARVMTQRNAAQAYWRWFAAGRRVAVYRRLQALAEGRMSGLERRAEAGDVADVAVVENRQNLLRRRSLLRNAERDFDAAAIELSLYLRDAAGNPRRPAPVELPEAFPEPGRIVADAELLVAEVLERRPELARIDNDAALERQRLRLAENALLPRVDLGLKAGHDLGGGSRTRDGFEAIVDVTVSIPLERRRGEGLVAESRARLRQLELDRRLTEDRFANEIRKLAVRINAARDFAAITAEEAAQALVMEQAERKRFDAGDSDFFVVNLREERTADAFVRNLDSRLDYFRHLTDLNASTVDLEALGL